MNRLRFSFLIVLIVCLVGRAQEAIELEPPTIDHVVYLIGDAGHEGDSYSTPVLELMKQLSASDQSRERTVVFLGDNIYPYGMHSIQSPIRSQDEAAIDAQIEAARAMTDNIVFLPGNHDWRQTKQFGLEHVRRQEAYIEAKLGMDAWLPDNGCAGPVDIDLNDDAVLIILDTQWWLHPYRKAAGVMDGCESSSIEDVMEELEDMMGSSQEKRKIVVGHHPMYTFGPHGGAYRFKDHIFPLTGVKKNLYIPMPIIGSIYPMYRKLLGNVQDMPHGKYLDMRTRLTSLFANYPGTVYAAGHEHSLQYIKQDSVNYIVSGSGCKTSFLSQSSRLEYGVSERGFSTVTIMSDGSMHLDFYTVSGGTEPTYSEQIAGPNPFTIEKEIAAEIETPPMWAFPDSVEVIPNAGLHASAFKRFIFGDLYRDIWTSPITVPVLNLDTAYGGIRPLKLGGGKQTRSMDLKSTQDKERIYTLRSIRKYPVSALEPEMRESVVKSIVEDGIAGSFPYGSLAIPAMSRSLGLLHTDPTLVYVPATYQLEEFKTIYGNTLALLEEEPEGKRLHEENLGNSEELIDSGDLAEEIYTSHLVDVADSELLRARLFDVMIGDWDRHEGQWAWARTGEGKIDSYRPIAQDRDQAFFRLDGLFPSIISSKWARKELQSFGPEINDIDGLTQNGRSMDRAYLNDLNWEEWAQEVEKIKSSLTDEVIEEGISQLPSIAYKLEGHAMKTALKTRRDNLSLIAREYYELLSEKVDVVGTNLEERFEVERLDDEHTRVRMFGIEDSSHVNDVLMFDRTFLRSETKEIRLYGLNGSDSYIISGEVDKGITVRIIGGFDDDRYVDNSIVKGLAKRTIIHETYNNNLQDSTHALGKEVKLRLNSNQDALIYLRDAKENKSFGPMLLSGYNIDDGGFFGLGFNYTAAGFRTDPYRISHKFRGVYSPLTESLDATYSLHRPRLLNNWGFGLDASYKGPDYAHNFYGYGNETNSTDEVSFKFPVQAISARPYIEYAIKQAAVFRLGGEFVDVQANNSFLQGLDSESEDFIPRLGEARYAGAFALFKVENYDDILDPERGIVFSAHMSARDVHGIDKHQYGLGTELRMYIPLTLLPGRTVWALRGGFNRTTGPLDPITAQSIGGDQEVRGMHRNRFTGNSNGYFTSELRIDLLKVKRSAIVPFKVGINAFMDGGRVWVDGGTDDALHLAFGGGVFLRPMKMAIISVDYGISDVDEALTVRLGHFF